MICCSKAKIYATKQASIYSLNRLEIPENPYQFCSYHDIKSNKGSMDIVLPQEYVLLLNIQNILAHKSVFVVFLYNVCTMGMIQINV